MRPHRLDEVERLGRHHNLLLAASEILRRRFHARHKADLEL